jgi:hypothetical protein
MGMSGTIAVLALAIGVVGAPVAAFAVAGGGGVGADVGTAGDEFSGPSPAASPSGGDTGASEGSQGGGSTASGGATGAAGSPGASAGGGAPAGGSGGLGGPGSGGSPTVRAPEPLVWGVTALALALASRLRRRRG